ncbi:hypothetical protein [Salinicola aestuarinus]|uniref:hypothetical protein n=1 Tax=Salinicola aestuarinus TaxID=1949082 RepID=UPI000DA24074|nr:hypothetical protein [Salinicola aestuarinus]
MDSYLLTIILASYNVEDTAELLELIEDGGYTYDFDAEKAYQHYSRAIEFERRIGDTQLGFDSYEEEEDTYIEEYEMAGMV